MEYVVWSVEDMCDSECPAIMGPTYRYEGSNVHTAGCTVYSEQFTVYSEQSTVYHA